MGVGGREARKEGGRKGDHKEKKLSLCALKTIMTLNLKNET